jgi:hypothetical protein
MTTPYALAVRRCAAAALLALTPGCALRWRDSTGQTHVLGLLHETRPAPSGVTPPIETTRNLGLMLYASPSHRGLSLGYNEESIVFPSESAPISPPAPNAPTTP